MPALRKFAFNSLPVELRKRLVAAVQSTNKDAAPIVFVPARAGGDMLGMVAIMIVSAILLLVVANLNFGNFNVDGMWQGDGAVLFYIGAVGAFSFALITLIWHILLRRSLPFDGGIYLFPLGLLDATSLTLRFYDLSRATDINSTHTSKNGIYAGTRFTFKFANEKSKGESKNKEAADMLVSSRVLADTIMPELNRRQAIVKDAVARRDAKTVFLHDPLFELRMGRVKVGRKPIFGELAAKYVPDFLRYRTFIAFFLGIVIGGLSWQIRNIKSDDAAFHALQASKREADWKDYLRAGHRHQPEAIYALPRIAFEEARRSRSVTKLRDVLRNYPNDGLDEEVKAEIHQLYVSSFDKFRGQAAYADPALVPFIEQLLGALEASGTSTVQLRFNRPSSDELVKMDNTMSSVANRRGKVLEPASPWFGPQSDGEREKRIAQGLQAGFSVIFPSDVMQIVPVTAVDPNAPLMDITYQISGSGQFYEDLDKTTMESAGNRVFVGLICKFDAKVSLPNQAPGWHFALAVQPPQTFNVESPKAANGRSVARSFPAPGKVYDVMAERAFEELHSKMRNTLFRPGSQAYQHALIGHGA